MNPLIKYLYNHPRTVVFATFVLTLSICFGVVFLIYDSEKTQEKLLVEQEANSIKNRLEGSLNHSITATKVLAFLVEKDLLGDFFDSISHDLLSQNPYMDALQIVQGNTIIKTFPLEGHEITIGYSVLDNELHFQEAMKALDRRSLYFDGPFDLIQGGRGIVGRMPILKNETYWGFSAVIIHFDTLLEAAGLNETGENDLFLYQFVKIDKSRPIDTFFEHDIDLTNGVVYSTFIPLGDWFFHVKLKNPNYIGRTLLFLVLGLFLTLFITLFIHKLVNEPQKLEKLVEEKTKELTELNSQLNTYSRNLELSNNELEQFAYVASHDLLEPLRMISSFMDRLKTKYADNLDEKANTYIHYAVDGSLRMRRIILDLLEFSRIGRFEEEIEEIDLNGVVKEFLLLHRELIHEKKATILYDELPIVKQHRAPMTHLFHNLLDNSIKYQKEGIPPEIKLTCIDKGKKWEFSIIDNGLGIKNEYFDRIFLLYQRLHPKNSYPGTGMGLAIVKKIILNIGGEIWLESEVDKGSIFYFTIPKN